MAVYTALSDPEMRAILEDYDLPALQSYEGIREGIENTNYRIVLGTEKFVLTIFEGRTDVSALPFILKFIAHLQAKGLPVPPPLANRQGREIGSFRSKSFILVPHLDGQNADPSDLDLCRDLGTMLARMHSATEDFALTRRNPLDLSGLAEMSARSGRGLDQIEAGLSADLKAEIEFLARKLPPGLPWGVIHSDLFPDNVLVTHGRVSGLIDFYFSSSDALVYDLAVTLSAWSFDDHGQFREDRYHAMLKGYVSDRPLTSGERAALPLMLRRAALRFLLTRAEDWLQPAGLALVDRKDPVDFLRRLRFYREIGSLPGS